MGDCQTSVARMLTAGSQLSLVFLALLLSLECVPAVRGECWYGHSLHYKFTITPKNRPGYPWCELQGQMDNKTFLFYDCGNEKAQPIGPLGVKLSNTKVWELQRETLKDLVDELKKALLDIKPNILTPRDPFSLQGSMMCQCGTNGHTHGSWQFGFDGQIFLLIESENRNWTAVHPEGKLMKEKWEKDRDISEFFKKVSMGDCKSWLEKFGDGREKIGESTSE